MKAHQTSGLCLALVLAGTLAAGAQTPADDTQDPQEQQGQTSTAGQDTEPGTTGTSGTQASTTGQESSKPSVTITGCVQKESDVTGGGGLGKGNEFVLTNATHSSSAPASAPSAGSPSSADSPSSPTGTTGSMSGGPSATYSLTGNKEGELSSLLGRRVEVMGRLKGDASAAMSGGAAASGAAGTTGDAQAGTTTGGTTASGTTAGTASGTGSGTSSAGATASGAGTTARASMPEIEVTSFREVPGSCTSGNQ